jgi:DNA-binding LytR/AlgR family response regulator
MLREWPELTVVEACEDGGAALDAIGEHQPDIAFLDIRMPGLTGLEVAAAVADVSPQTQIVFVTAYDQYAIDAFDKGAVDYLLKPVVRERLVATIARLKARMSAGGPDADALAALIRQLGVTLPKKSAELPRVWLTASSGETPDHGRRCRLFQSDNNTVVMIWRTPLRVLDKLDPTHFYNPPRPSLT